MIPFQQSMARTDTNYPDGGMAPGQGGACTNRECALSARVLFWTSSLLLSLSSAFPWCCLSACFAPALGYSLEFPLTDVCIGFYQSDLLFAPLLIDSFKSIHIKDCCVLLPYCAHCEMLESKCSYLVPQRLIVCHCVEIYITICHSFALEEMSSLFLLYNCNSVPLINTSLPLLSSLPRIW